MVFPTLQFVLFFVVVLSLNGMVWHRSGWRKALLITASYVFYAAWDVRFLALMAGVSTIAWLAGLGVRRPGLRRMSKVVGIGLLIGTLGFFKYYNFFTLSLQQMLEGTVFARDLSWLTVILPVGISFYVFQAISYVMDVDRRDIEPRRNPADIFLYISFFPQLVAGPIVRAADFLPQLDAPSAPDRTARAVAVLLILTGLFKKMVIANYLSVLLVDPTFGLADGQNALTAFLGMMGYAVQIYCDFSGYSDIAIGVALLLGYRFQRNFNQPYRADSLRNFWQRWHISLSTWIRDYLYIPLGGSHGSVARGVSTVILTMTLAGLWHGAGWNFLLWGFLHGVGLAVERLLRRAGMRLPRFAAISVTLLFVCLLWIPFRAPDVTETLAYLAAFTRVEGFAPTEISVTVLALLALGFAMNWLPQRWLGRIELGLSHLPAMMQALVLALGVWFLFASAQEGVAPFIYFQF